MNMDFLLDARNLGAWLYALLFLAAFFEATLTLFAAAFLVSQGVASFFPAMMMVLTGCLLEEMLWYWIGAHLRQSSRISRWVDRFARYFDKHFQYQLFKTLVVSKFIYGAHRAAVARAGMLKIPLSKYMKNAFFALGFWLIVVASLGFGFAASYKALKEYFKYAELVFLAVVVGFFVVEFLLSKLFEKEQ